MLRCASPAESGCCLASTVESALESCAMAASVLPACLSIAASRHQRLDRWIGGGGAFEERTRCGEVSCACFDDAHRQTKLTYAGLEPTPVLRFRGQRNEWLGSCVDAPRGRDVIGFVLVLNGLQHEAERAADERWIGLRKDRIGKHGWSRFGHAELHEQRSESHADVG